MQCTDEPEKDKTDLRNPRARSAKHGSSEPEPRSSRPQEHQYHQSTHTHTRTSENNAKMRRFRSTKQQEHKKDNITTPRAHNALRDIINTAIAIANEKQHRKHKMITIDKTKQRVETHDKKTKSESQKTKQ